VTIPDVSPVDVQYAETYRFLCSLDRFGILLGLDNIRSLLAQLGDPQMTFPSVHITGSKGKGSTAAMTAGILQKAGHKVALYTSPHLNDFRERIRLNGVMVSKDAVIASTEKIRKVYDPERTTFFEFTTAVAFDCISEWGPDIAVIEVGLGGRLDATNTVRSIVTVITEISLEHEDYLGRGIPSIAGEKAGIIKPGVPLITGATRKEAKEVILGTAETLGSRAWQFGRDFVGVRTGSDHFTYKSGAMTLEGLRSGMAGAHQMKNASLACAVVETLRSLGYGISEAAIREGLETTAFPGRFEVLRRNPDVVIDGAHTPDSMRLLKSTTSKLYPGVKPFVLLGMLAEKDYHQMSAIMAPIAREVVCVAPQGDRSLDAESLASAVGRHGVPVRAAAGIEEGFAMLMERAGFNDLILATGSLYMIGPVRRACGIADDA
jgi:dihydrofolate synthase / folylpolyglutamate synthase